MSAKLTDEVSHPASLLLEEKVSAKLTDEVSLVLLVPRRSETGIKSRTAGSGGTA
ncbi:MAG: hypothetical protein IJH53_03510 [Oscillospiraceae bacterium]|nr:hypothetical protein [Oscillospiraceae bacterium]